ncbi:hypothetical protein ACCC98_02875 [Rhizobium pisi]
MDFVGLHGLDVVRLPASKDEAIAERAEVGILTGIGSRESFFVVPE